eukprot:9471907-Pyramimonas_sp.AAC.1
MRIGSVNGSPVMAGVGEGRREGQSGRARREGPSGRVRSKTASDGEGRPNRPSGRVTGDCPTPLAAPPWVGWNQRIARDILTISWARS